MILAGPEGDFGGRRTNNTSSRKSIPLTEGSKIFLWNTITVFCIWFRKTRFDETHCLYSLFPYDFTGPVFANALFPDLAVIDDFPDTFDLSGELTASHGQLDLVDAFITKVSIDH